MSSQVNRSLIQAINGIGPEPTASNGIAQICTNPQPAFAAADPSHPPVPDVDLVSCFRGEDMRVFERRDRRALNFRRTTSRSSE
jgi:hypothetical protein